MFLARFPVHEDLLITTYPQVLTLEIDEAQSKVAREQAHQAALAEKEKLAAATRAQRERIEEQWVPRVSFHARQLVIQMSRLGMTDDVVKQWCEWIPKVLVELQKQTGKLQNAIVDLSHNQMGREGLRNVMETFRK